MELHEAVATREQLKQELFSSVQRMAVKDHEAEQVVKVAENTTVRIILQRIKRNRAKMEMRALRREWLRPVKTWFPFLPALRFRVHVSDHLALTEQQDEAVLV